MLRATLAVLAASLCACTAPLEGPSDRCDGTCDASAPRDVGRFAAPGMATCRIQGDERLLVCELTSETIEGVALSGVALTIETDARTAPVGTVLRPSQPRYQRLLGTAEHSVSIEARFIVDEATSRALGANELSDLRSRVELLEGQLDSAALAPPIEVWRLEVLGHGLFSDLIVHSPITGNAMEPLSTPPGARQVIEIVNHIDGPALEVSIIDEHENVKEYELEEPAIYALTSDSLEPARPDLIPVATMGSVAIQCTHVREAVRCEVQDLPKGTIGKVPIDVFTADGAHHRFTISERFPAQLSIPAQQMPVVVRADIELQGQVLGLPPDSRVVRSEGPLDRDGSIGLALPFELWDVSVHTNSELTTITVDPYILELGRTMQGWFQYEAVGESVEMLSSSEDQHFVVAAPSGARSLSATLKNLEENGHVPTVLEPGGLVTVEVEGPLI